MSKIPKPTIVPKMPPVKPCRKESAMTLGDAIEELIRKYFEACGQQRIRNPLAYALHETWKQADKEEEHDQHE